MTDKLKTAILGLDDNGQLLLKTASQIDYFHIQAVADKNTKLTENIAAQYQCHAYDDYRRLIIENQFDCLLVAAGMYSCDEYIHTAIKKKFNILKLAPPARNFAEAAKFVRLADQEDVKFIVANLNRFAQSFIKLREFIQQYPHKQISLLRSLCYLSDQTGPDWHKDTELSGGGVLLRNCYDIIDQIIWTFGSPQQVYSVNTNQAGDRQKRLYLTEDTVVLTTKFSDTFLGNLIASKSFGPPEKFLKIYAKDEIITVSNNKFTVSDRFGAVKKQTRYNDNTASCMRKLLENFALSILHPEENKPCCTGLENLKNMAVIESAYLSARTQTPEEPHRIFEMEHV